MSKVDHRIYIRGGKLFDVECPDPAMIRLGDIAHALSNLCRWGGHSSHFYSVAQHSVAVSELLPKRLALAGLMHDAAEAYLIDIPRPLKSMFPRYYEIEKNLLSVIGQHFGIDDLFTGELPPPVQYADNIELQVEENALIFERSSLKVLTPSEAENLFLATRLCVQIDKPWRWLQRRSMR